jgi:hypothetical protein
MSIGLRTVFLLPLLVSTGLLTFASPTLSDSGADCRAEAEQYGISSEEMESYVEGCMQSRGESADVMEGDQAGTSLAEPDDLPASAAGIDEPEMAGETGIEDAVETGAGKLNDAE